MCRTSTRTRRRSANPPRSSRRLFPHDYGLVAAGKPIPSPTDLPAPAHVACRTCSGTCHSTRDEPDGATAGARAERAARIFGPDAGTEIALPAVGVVVGADPAWTSLDRRVRLEAAMSTVVATEAGFEVTDLGSRNNMARRRIAHARGGADRYDGAYRSIAPAALAGAQESLRYIRSDSTRRPSARCGGAAS